MSLSFFVLWALAGWCAPSFTSAGSIRSEPVPMPWLVARIVGVVGGVAGGLIFALVFRAEPVPFPWQVAVYAAATSVGAFVGGRLVSDIYARSRESGRTAAG